MRRVQVEVIGDWGDELECVFGIRILPIQSVHPVGIHIKNHGMRQVYLVHCNGVDKLT